MNESERIDDYIARLEAELRTWRGCPSCMEDHPEGTICPPHEVRVNGIAWRQRQTRQQAARAEKAEAERDRLKADVVNLQSALVAAGHEDGCPVVRAASVDYVPGSECIDWRSRAQKAEVERHGLKRQLVGVQAQLEGAIYDTNVAVAKCRNLERQLAQAEHGADLIAEEREAYKARVVTLECQLAECKAEIGKEQERGDRWRKMAAQYRIERENSQAEAVMLRETLEIIASAPAVGGGATHYKELISRVKAARAALAAGGSQT